MREKTHYSEVFKAVEKAVEVNSPKLTCGSCGKKFYMITMVGEDEPDFVYLTDDGSFTCDDHLNYDLLVNPEIVESILIGKTIHKGTRKAQVHVKRVGAHIFIPGRMN